ncbi:hypothetical protein [Streptomyces fagopyri]|uniref:hypothetical protein n=1 Tax=Streptomyces fagopyri TaxID=2662397 RepID=UPI003711E975
MTAATAGFFAPDDPTDRPSLVRASRDRPSLVRASRDRPSLVRPSPDRPSLVRPAVVRIAVDALAHGRQRPPPARIAHHDNNATAARHSGLPTS